MAGADLTDELDLAYGLIEEGVKFVMIGGDQGCAESLCQGDCEAIG